MVNDILENLSIINFLWFIIDLSLILLGNRLLHWTVNSISKKKTYPKKTLSTLLFLFLIGLLFML